MKKVVIINRTNTDNYGDKIISNTMKFLFSDNKFKVQTRDYIFNKKSRILNHFFRDKLNELEYKRNIRFIKKADIIIIGGGELLSGESHFYSALKKWIDIIDKYNPKAKKFIFACGVTNSFSDKTIIQKFDKVYVRDEFSKEILESIVGKELSLIEEIPDCVFGFKLKRYKKKNRICLGVTDINRHNKHKLIPFKSNEELIGYYDEILTDIKYEYPNSTVNLIYNTKSDYIYSKMVYKALKGKYKFLKLKHLHSEKNLIREICSSKLIISPRMHALIIAMISQTKYKPIVISNKINSFVKKYDKSNDIKLLKKQVLKAVSDIKNS